MLPLLLCVVCAQVSRLQVAELVTAAVLNPELAENKCLEVVAETAAPALALEALLEQAATEITKVCGFGFWFCLKRGCGKLQHTGPTHEPDMRACSAIPE